MTIMRQKIRLSRLRDIGWTLWDPINLTNEGETWDQKPYADEYDSYLMQAAGQLRRKVPVTEVVDYLVQIESVHMGFGSSPSQRKACEKVVAAILADEQLWTS